MEPIKILISACLLGEKVRYDGQHKRDAFLVETLGQYVEWVRVCPEVDCGLPVPREAMRLVGDAAAPRLVGNRTGEDFTARMVQFARARLRALEGVELCGYVCKKGSPSSGMERVKLYDEHGVPRPAAAGIFTRLFMEHFPLVPVEEEGRLQDPVLREMFVERVFCLKRWRDLVRGGATRGRLVEFHTDHKMLLLAHGRVPYTALGRLVAGAKERPVGRLYDEYLAGFMAALGQRLTARKITDVLTHMAGHLRGALSAAERQELRGLIGQYHDRLVPLVAPLTLLKHHVRKHGVEYLARQVFLDPHPVELMLRNHV
ncbi:MAG TPA: DUF523 and DUF1722 domain-containing protein [Polyangia bacterium]|jgi:uncharacterized protein YbgA (DUF1722 family)/uncharacterized protein YbbK (DUF523 family)